MLGAIHSIETFGLVDGPGVRYVIFMQGCHMRCKFCHNADTWKVKGPDQSAESVLKKALRYRPYWKENGGITVSGGEPLLQIEFVTELFKQAKEKNIHTALDTSGILFNPNNTNKIDALLKYTDLVLLDIKHINDEEHKKLTGMSNKNILEFAKYLSDKQIPIWIRHVVVKSITYDKKYLEQLGEFLAKLNNIKALDVLPYHDMAIPKYENLGIDYPLKEIEPTTKEEALNARNIIFESYKRNKNIQVQ